MSSPRFAVRLKDRMDQMMEQGSLVFYLADDETQDLDLSKVGKCFYKGSMWLDKVEWQRSSLNMTGEAEENEPNVNLYYVLFGEGGMFEDPLVSAIRQVEAFAKNIGDVREFLYYFKRSSIVQYFILQKTNGPGRRSHIERNRGTKKQNRRIGEFSPVNLSSFLAAKARSRLA
jgi:hypothetical protein